MIYCLKVRNQFRPFRATDREVSGRIREKAGKSRENLGRKQGEVSLRNAEVTAITGLCRGVYTLLHCFSLCHRRIFAADLSKLKKMSTSRENIITQKLHRKFGDQTGFLTRNEKIVTADVPVKLSTFCRFKLISYLPEFEILELTNDNRLRISTKNILKSRFSLKTTYICSELLFQDTLISTGKCILPEFIQVKNLVNIFEEVSLFPEGTFFRKFDQNEPKQIYPSDLQHFAVRAITIDKAEINRLLWIANR